LLAFEPRDGQEFALDDVVGAAGVHTQPLELLVMSENIPPPTYSQQDPVDTPQDHHSEPQILIIPTVDAVNFQKGFLGAEGEHAAIEGELQIKGAHSDRWTRL